MTGEVAVPMLPCRSIDEITDFYEALGFTTTYRQTRPNPYVALRREDFELHFFGMDGFDPRDSYGTCGVRVPDTGALHKAFADGMRAKYGKVLVSGTPRMTTPRRRKNSGCHAGFTIVDPGGNWVRIFPAEGRPTAEPPSPTGKLTVALDNAVVMGDSHGDDRQAAKVLDGALRREAEQASPTELVEALVYRAELAVRLDDPAAAREALDRARAVPLDADQRRHAAAALANADTLAASL